MVTEVEMTVWIQSVWSCETVKDKIVDEAHGKSELVNFGPPCKRNKIGVVMIEIFNRLISKKYLRLID